jgi:hypothetical protein
MNWKSKFLNQAAVVIPAVFQLQGCRNPEKDRAGNHKDFE